MSTLIDRTSEELEGDTHWIDSGDPTGIRSFQVTSDGEGGYGAFGEIIWNFEGTIPEELGLEGEAAQDYLNERSWIVDQFVRDRYEGDLMDSGDYTENLEFYVPLGPGPVTEEQAIEAVWENTKAVLFLNEMDPGTFGHIYAGRILTEMFRAYDEEQELQAA